NVTRHPLQKNGATFAAEKETFIRIPRPTGIAADGQGNIYVASWKGATFNYTGPNVGFVLRVLSLNSAPKPFPNLNTLSDTELVALLASPSSTRRLHVQREILRRQPRSSFVNKLNDLVGSSRELPVRAAAIFTLGQIENPAAQKALIKLSGESALREFALRALADPKPRAAKLPSKVFVSALQDQNPATRLQAILALNRLQRTETAENIFPFLTDPDPAIAHAAFRALVSFRAADVCYKALDQSDSGVTRAALRVLGNLHEISVVDRLIGRLEKSATTRSEILETLCRLYHREADWDGSWWTTRPDISGPFYKPVVWAGTERITSILRNELSKNDPTTTRFLLLQFQKYKIESPAIPVAALASIVSDSKLEMELRKKAFQSVTKISDEKAIDTLVACDAKEKFTKELSDAFVRDPKRFANIDAFAKIAAHGSAPESGLAYAILLNAARNTNATARTKTLADEAIASGKNPAALHQAKIIYFPDENQPGATPLGPNAIAKLSYEETVRRAAAANGDIKTGAKLFETVGCVKCHTAIKDESPKGPFLGDITTRYNDAEILE
ncbi:MAG: HEAT repeat domain-containing protein, partial [Verrucomicrobiota bacterium]